MGSMWRVCFCGFAMVTLTTAACSDDEGSGQEDCIGAECLPDACAAN